MCCVNLLTTCHLHQLVFLYRLLFVSSQVMESFVAHVCLIRPLGEGGKMRVAMDLAQLELVLGLFCRGDVSSLGHPYKMLRALRLLLLHVDDIMVFGRRYCCITYARKF